MAGIRTWLVAIRPRTLPAAISPVLVGTAVAAAEDRFRPMPAFAAFAGAVLLQIGVNLANDYFDFSKGVDTPERLGPVRVTQSGLIPPSEVLMAMILSFALAALAGITLALSGAPWVFVLGGASILAALLYSGGPFPLASHGLGDLFAFLFFGPVAVCGTYYVQTLGLNRTALLLSLPVGFLVASILVVNNLRDIPTDKKVGKRTLAVIVGVRAARVEYKMLLICAYAAPVLLYVTGSVPPWALFPLFSIPRAARVARSVKTLSGPGLNHALAETAALTLLFSILLSIGLIAPLFLRRSLP